MKTTTLPPLRVTPKFRKAIESVLNEGESLSSFILDAVEQHAAHRREQKEFVKKALARSRKTERTQKYVSADDVFKRLEKVLADAKTRADAR